MYTKLPLGTSNPGLLILLIDQSGSMSEPYANTTKATFAALAVNRCIYDIILSCSAGEVVKDRLHLAVIGYGEKTEVIVAGRASEIFSQVRRTEIISRKEPDGAGGLVEIKLTLPVWVEPSAGNGTPTEEAFDLASELIEAWVRENPDNFPPLVINITDGIPNDAVSAANSAGRLMRLSTSDGNTLLLNAHIGDSGEPEINLPSDAEALPGENARFLFGISSVLPAPLFAAARNSAFWPQPGARGFIMNAGPETFTKLLVFGSAPVR